MERRQLLAIWASLLLTPFVSAQEAKTKLMIYCGVTMSKAIADIADLFKQQHPDLDIVILRGGSKDLYDTINASRVGDLYLPGEPVHLSDRWDNNLFAESVNIGVNQVALMVVKGNPKAVQPDLQQLLRKDLVTVLSTPDQGAIGVMTQKILDRYDLYEAAIAHASLLMSDGRSLTQAIQRGEGDLCLNWKAGISFAPNDVEVIPLPDDISPKQPLLLTKLIFSKQEVLAEQFMQFAAGEQGQIIMRRYGF